MNKKQSRFTLLSAVLLFSAFYFAPWAGVDPRTSAEVQAISPIWRQPVDQTETEFRVKKGALLFPIGLVTGLWLIGFQLLANKTPESNPG